MMEDASRSSAFDFVLLENRYGTERAEMIAAEHEAAEFVRQCLDRAASTAVRWGMERWGDDRAGYLFGYFEAALDRELGRPVIPERAPGPKARLPISATKRVAIFARDGYQCVRCGSKEPELLSLDHIIPVSKGGSDDAENLRTFCRSCNSSKGTKVE